MKHSCQVLLSKYKIGLGAGLAVILFSSVLAEILCACFTTGHVSVGEFSTSLRVAGAVGSLISGYGLVRTLERILDPTKAGEAPADQESGNR